MDRMVVLAIIITLLGFVLVVGMIAYNAFQLDRWERYETAKEMREAMRWADTSKMRKQHDYRAVLRGR